MNYNSYDMDAQALDTNNFDTMYCIYQEIIHILLL